MVRTHWLTLSMHLNNTLSYPSIPHARPRFGSKLPNLEKRNEALQDKACQDKAALPFSQKAMLMGVLSIPVILLGLLSPEKAPEKQKAQPKAMEQDYFQPGKTLTWEKYNQLGHNYLVTQSKACGCLDTQAKLIQAMEPEVYPALLKVFEPDEKGQFQFDDVIVGSFNEPTWKAPGDDGGRGLRIVFRKDVMVPNHGMHRIRAIGFYDVNPKTGELELLYEPFVPLVEQGDYTPDTMRILLELEKPADLTQGLLGTSLVVKRDLQSGKVLDIQPGVYNDEGGHARKTVRGDAVFDGLTASTCSVCHDRHEGLVSDDSPFADIQLFLQRESQPAIRAFDHYLQEQGISKTMREKLQAQLENPKANAHKWVPKGLVDVLRQKVKQVHTQASEQNCACKACQSD